VVTPRLIEALESNSAIRQASAGFRHALVATRMIFSCLTDLPSLCCRSQPFSLALLFFFSQMMASSIAGQWNETQKILVLLLLLHLQLPKSHLRKLMNWAAMALRL
jgi:hypothetical protein